MIKRPDLNVVAKLVADRKMTINEGKAWLKLPFFDIPHGYGDVARSTGLYDFIETETKDGIYKGGSETTLSMFLDGEFYFDEFILHTDNEFTKIKMSEDRKLVYLEVIPANRGERRDGVIPFSLSLAEKFDDGRTLVEFGTEAKWLREYLLNVEAAYAQRLTRFGLATILNCVMFRDFNNQRDRYLVKVEPTDKPKKPKGLSTPRTQLVEAIGPRIIYLAKLPSVGDSENGGNGGVREMTPHQRRGYWITLKAERFKYHPKYMVENGVYRKPAWVGPKEAIVEGNIYTILE